MNIENNNEEQPHAITTNAIQNMPRYPHHTNNQTITVSAMKKTYPIINSSKPKENITPLKDINTTSVPINSPPIKTLEPLPNIELTEMIKEVVSNIMKYKKMPLKKQKQIRCPQYGCWKVFKDVESLKKHISSLHDWMKTNGIEPTSDGKFIISEQVLRTVYNYSKTCPTEFENTVIDVEKEIY